MGNPKRTPLRKLLTSIDLWLALMALGLISMLAVHLYLWKSMVSLVKPNLSARTEIVQHEEKSSPREDKAVGALKAAGEGDTFKKVVQAARTRAAGTPLTPASKDPATELVTRFDSFVLDPSRTEFTQKVSPFFKPGSSPADHSLAFLLNLELSNVAVPPDIGELKSRAYTVIADHPEDSLSATHRIVTLLDNSDEAVAFREVLRKVIVQINQQPGLNSADQRRQIGDIERFLGGS
jgi:hypothetical protein